MRPELSSYIIVVAVATMVTVVAVPAFIWLSMRWDCVARPDQRRVHERPTPILGGGAMYLGFVAAFGFAWWSGLFAESFEGTTEPLAILVGVTIAYAVGVIDDARELSPPAKIAGMVLAGAGLAVGGVSIIWFRVPFLDVFVLPYDLAFVVTVVWVLGMSNAINFIDGLDGLAAGVTGIAAGAFLLYGLQLGRASLLLPGNIGPLVAAAVVGVCLGFLPWNFHPARIFMGDGGSLLLGTLMAASTMAVGGRTPDPYSGQTFFFYAPLVIPLVILGVPVFDTAFAIVRRAKGGRSVAGADKDHLHHRLLRLGHGHRRAVWILWAWTAVLSLFVLFPVFNAGRGDAWVPTGVLAFALALFTLFHPRRASTLGQDEPGRASQPESAGVVDSPRVEPGSDLVGNTDYGIRSGPSTVHTHWVGDPVDLVEPARARSANPFPVSPGSPESVPGVPTPVPGVPTPVAGMPTPVAGSLVGASGGSHLDQSKPTPAPWPPPQPKVTSSGSWPPPGSGSHNEFR